MQHAKNAYILAMLVIKSIYILLIYNGLTDIINNYQDYNLWRGGFYQEAA